MLLDYESQTNKGIFPLILNEVLETLRIKHNP